MLATAVLACAGVALVGAPPVSAQAAAGGTAPAAGTPAARPAAHVVRAPSPLRIDGRLDEDAWQHGVVLADFVQREPLEGMPASERTEVRILHDDEALYIGAWLYDRQAGAIVQGEARRDADLGDTDALLLILDTYLDRQNGFVFGTTPAGIEYDGQVTREGDGGASQVVRQQSGSGGGFNKNWDGSWQVATSRDEHGWYAEFRIPFSTLRYRGSGAQTWGLNIARRIRRNNEESVWAPIPRQYDIHRVSLAGTIALEAPATRSVRVTPYVLGSGRRDYLAGSGTERGFDAGADARIGLSSSLTLDLTLNTDFAQVEVDEEEINLTRFRLFLPEKRPFFLENAGTFAVGSPQEVELFFSRRIGIAASSAVPIVGGGRLTGRVGGTTVGLLAIQTDELSRDSGTETVLVAPANNYSVARALREWPNRTRLGAILVNRIATGDAGGRNHTWGVDGRLGIGAALTLEGYVAGTHSEPAAAMAPPPAAPGDGIALSAGATYNDADWTIGASARDVQRGFNPEAGFLARGEHRFVSGRVLRRVRFDDVSWFRELRPHATYREYFDLDGFSMTRLIHLDSHFVFGNGAFFQLPAINFTREGLKEPFEISRGVVVPPGTYDNLDWGFVYNTNTSAPVSLRGSIDIGGFYSGWRAGAAATVGVRFSDAFTVSLRAARNDVNLPEGDFETTQLRLRAAYSFSPRVYLQSLLQYNDQTRTLSSNVRFGWLSTAGTGLFVVFNDLEQVSDLEQPGAPLRRRGPHERAVVIKFTRQFDVR